ncbi:MAG: hypothetical protein H0V66_02755 [Bdellovibrionales bacterium]|nr:hypothetical protein [Bdellovibrionales bacterium]
MKNYYLLFLLLVGGLIFIMTKPNPERRQAQEEAPMTEQITEKTFRIKMDIETENDQPVADILWFQQAAQLALDKKIPWFNVLEQHISPTNVEGVIELINDPMQAEYDANEILSLHLKDEFAQ